jgi:superfamily II DNA or RNA helicase
MNEPRAGDREATIQEIYRALAADDVRNNLIENDVIQAIEEGRSPIVLTERKDHLESLANRLKGYVREIVVLQGGVTGRERRALTAKLAAIADREARLVLATGRYIGEGFDDARLDTLFLTMPVSWKGTLVQYAGRLHRLHSRKREVRIHDYVDREIPMLARMFEKRLATYRAIGYGRHDAPLEYDEPIGPPMPEWDDEEHVDAE